MYNAFKNVNTEYYNIIVATQYPTDSALVLAYEHIVIQMKYNTDMIYLRVVGKALSGLLKTIFTIWNGRWRVCTQLYHE